jgi:hypothetical protein
MLSDQRRSPPRSSSSRFFFHYAFQAYGHCSFTSRFSIYLCLVRQKIKEKENKGKENDSFLKKMVLDVGRLLDCAGFGCWNLF